MKVFIVGASGLVGSHCLKYFKEQRVETTGSHYSFPTRDTIYFDPLDSDQGFNLKEYDPDVIVHCGALTNVDYCESNPDESTNLTLKSAERLTDYCREYKKKLIYISTDYVFDGTAGPYYEHQKTNPINVYGQHKLLAEQAVSTLDDYLICRITNVYGEEIRAKNFIARLIDFLSNNVDKHMSLPYDQFATPVYAGDIARMIFLLIRDRKKGIYNLSSNDYYNRYQLAFKVKSYFPENSSVTLSSVSSMELKQTAIRPLNGGLLNNKFITEYPDFICTTIDSFLSKITKHVI